MSAPLTSKRQAAFILTAAVIVGGVVIMALMLGLFGSAVFERVTWIEKTWQNYAKDADRRMAGLTALNRAVGYGNFIHTLKDYLLHGGVERFRRVEQGRDQVRRALAELKSLPLQEEERQALVRIGTVFEQYFTSLPRIRSEVEAGRPAAEIDASLRVADEPALAGLDRLSAVAAERNRDVDRRTGVAFAATLAFMHLGLIIVPLIIGVGVVLLVYVWRITVAHGRLDQALMRIDILLDHAPDAILVIDDDQRIRRANAKAVALFGTGAAPLAGQPVETFLPLRCVTKTRAGEGSDPRGIRGETGKGESVTLRDCDVTTADGTVLATEVTLSRSQESREGMTTAIIRDVTKRKQAEAALQTSEEWHRALFDNAGVAIAVVDRAGLYRQVNRAWLDMLGLPWNFPELLWTDRRIKRIISSLTISFVFKATKLVACLCLNGRWNRFAFSRGFTPRAPRPGMVPGRPLFVNKWVPRAFGLWRGF